MSKINLGKVVGNDGKSAYEIWLEQGNTGTKQDFLNSLNGKDGVDGKDGVNGKDGKDYVLTIEDKTEIAGLIDVDVTGEVVPAYVRTEAERVADNILSVRNADSFVFAGVSDLHTDGIADEKDNTVPAIKNLGKALTIINDYANLDLFAIFGDVITEYFTDNYREGFKYVRECFSDIRKSTPSIQLQGNHDHLKSDTTEQGEQKYWAYIGANNVGVVTDYANKFRNYGYKDFENYKIRVIYLNTADVSAGEVTGDWHISNEQMTWLINTAFDLSDKTDQAEWGVIIFSHHHIGYGNNNLLTVVNAFKGKEESGTITHNGETINFDFSNVSAEFISHFHGHLHNFRAETLGTNKLLTITIPNACYPRNNEYGTHPDYSAEVHEKCGDPDENGNQRVFAKTSNSAKETAFNVVSVDRKNKKIYCYNYGAGIDRIWDYANGIELKTYNISTELTNCTASQSNVTEIHSTDENVSLTFTAETGYTLPTEIEVVGAEYTWDSTTGNLVLSKARRNVIITIVAEANAGTPVSYSITNTLAKITNNNATNTIEENTSYNATLIPDDGYEFRNDIVVTMGEEDITANAFSNGVINIAEVTGNITITGSAKRQGYEVDIASIGYTDDKRWSTSTGEFGSGGAGYVAINLIEFERDEGEVALVHLYSTKDDAGNWLVDWKKGSNCTKVCYANGEKVAAGYLSTEDRTTTASGSQNYHNEDGTVTVRVIDAYGSGAITQRINGIKVSGYGLGENARIRISYE